MVGCILMNIQYCRKYSKIISALGQKNFICFLNITNLGDKPFFSFFLDRITFPTDLGQNFGLVFIWPGWF